MTWDCIQTPTGDKPQWIPGRTTTKKNLPPYKQSHAVCKPKPASLFVVINASQALVDTVSACILKQYFPISKCLQKQNIKGSVFYGLRPVFSGPSACASYLVLCNAEGASISEDPPHPYQRRAFI